MSRMRLDHWFVDDKGISISLMRFFVNIIICTSKDKIFFKVEIVDDGIEKLYFNFTSLEDAVLFIEEIVSKCLSCEEVEDRYNKIYCQKRRNLEIKKTR